MKQYYTFLISLIVLFIPSRFLAQVQWFTPDANWDFHITTGWVGTGLEHISIGNSTLQHDGQTYLAIERDFQYVSGSQNTNTRYLRQDGSKIFALGETGLGTYQPFLMYDFGLDVGDTVRIPQYAQYQGFGYIIVKTDFLQMLGASRRIQEVTWLVNNQPVGGHKSVFVEGFGNVEGLHMIGGAWCLNDSYLFLDEPSAIAVDGSERIFCSYTNNQGTYKSVGVSFCNTLDAKQPETLSVRIWPNPSNGVINIQADESTDLKYRLTDLQGRLISEGRVNDMKIETTYCGLALLQISNRNSSVTEKVLIR